MNPDGQSPRELTDEALDKEFTIKFTRRELTIIFNMFFSREYRLADARVVIPIIQKIESPVTALTNQDYKDAPKVTGDQELSIN